jgi:hypothetical protein
LANENSFLSQDNPVTEADSAVKQDSLQTSKKKFVEPEISMPVDVLEATTFFQTASSGATN